MADLRLIGVHEDGAHLVLADPDGARHRLALDDALRAAARRDRPRLGQLQIEIDGGLRPREVQALLRAGASIEEAAERAGWTVEKVGKYAGPILAEREHIAAVARAVRLRSLRGGSGPTLLSRVDERLTARGVDPATATWDSWRRDGSEWVVVLSFAAGGRQRSASWTYDVRSRSVTARDDEARWLSEDEPGQAQADLPVYDVEAEGGLESPARRREPSPHDLTAAMRQASGAKQRRSPVRRRGTEPMALPIEADLNPEMGESEPGAATTIPTGYAADGGHDSADTEREAMVVHLDSRREPGRAAPASAPDHPADLAPEPPEPSTALDPDESARTGDDQETDGPEDPAQPAPAKLTPAERRSALAQERLKSTWDSFLFGPARTAGARPEGESDSGTDESL